MKILPTYASLQISMGGSVNVASRLRLLSVIKIGVDIIIISSVYVDIKDSSLFLPNLIFIHVCFRHLQFLSTF